MKKIVSCLFFALLCTGIICATDFSMSAGGGLFIGGHFTRYTLNANGVIDGVDSNGLHKDNPVTVFSSQKINQLNAGAFIFFDATWAELNVSFLNGMYKYEQTMYAESDGQIQMGRKSPQSGRGWENMLGISLLGKYPFELNETLTVFPLLGVDYQISLLQRRQKEGSDTVYDRADGISEMKDSNDDPYTLSAWNALFIVLGGGLDYHFADTPLFFRGELLYSIRLPTPWENDSLKTLENSVNPPENPKLGGLSSGPTLKLAAGWRFY